MCSGARSAGSGARVLCAAGIAIKDEQRRSTCALANRVESHGRVANAYGARRRRRRLASSANVRPNSSLVVLIGCSVAVVVVASLCSLCTVRADDISNAYNIQTSQNSESIEIGNTNTNNYNIRAGQYRPTQMTQVVLNVPKLSKAAKLRRARPPTLEEFEIKHRIIDIYDHVKRKLLALERANELASAAATASAVAHNSQHDDGDDDDGDGHVSSASAMAVASGQHQHEAVDWLPAFEHLGRIIHALNPKYIATERVRRVAFEPNTLLATPEQDLRRELERLYAVDGEPPLELTGAEDAPSVTEQLDWAQERFAQHVQWDHAFVDKLLETTPDATLNPSQLAFKRLVACLARPHLAACWPAASADQQDQQQVAALTAQAASALPANAASAVASALSRVPKRPHNPAFVPAEPQADVAADDAAAAAEDDAIAAPEAAAAAAAAARAQAVEQPVDAPEPLDAQASALAEARVAAPKQAAPRRRKRVQPAKKVAPPQPVQHAPNPYMMYPQAQPAPAPARAPQRYAASHPPPQPAAAPVYAPQEPQYQPQAPAQQQQQRVPRFQNNRRQPAQAANRRAPAYVSQLPPAVRRILAQNAQ